MRIVQHLDDGEQQLAFVPLGKGGGEGIAIIYEDDLALLEALGLSLTWFRHHRSALVIAPAYGASGGMVQVGRVLLNAGPGQNVRYANGDPTDLRRANLLLVEGFAVRSDRDHVKPRMNRQTAQSIKHVYV